MVRRPPPLGAKRRCRCVPTSTSRRPDPARWVSSRAIERRTTTSLVRGVQRRGGVCPRVPLFRSILCRRNVGSCSNRAAGGFPMRAILRTGFGGPEVLVIREIPEPEPEGRPRGDRGQGVRPEPRRAAHAQGGVGRDRRRQRHRVCRHRQILPRRRVRRRDEGGGPDGRAGPDDQRQLRRVHPRPRDERGGDRVGLVVGRPGGDSRDLRHGLDLPVPQPGDRSGQTLVIRGATSSFGQAASTWRSTPERR